MSKNLHWNSDFWFAGPHATFHHHFFQMVNLMMLHCKRTMNGLNPHEFQHEATENNAKHVEENNSPIKGEIKEQEQSRIKKLMTGCDFGWKTPSIHATRK